MLSLPILHIETFYLKCIAIGKCSPLIIIYNYHLLNRQLKPTCASLLSHVTRARIFMARSIITTPSLLHIIDIPAFPFSSLSLPRPSHDFSPKRGMIDLFIGDHRDIQEVGFSPRLRAKKTRAAVACECACTCISSRPSASSSQAAIDGQTIS